MIDHYGKNLLHTAIEKGHVNIIEYLISSSCELCVNEIDDLGNSALILCQNLSSSVFITKLLLIRMSKAMINHQNKAGETALMRAIVSRNISNIVHIIKAGSDVNLQNNETYSAISLAKHLKWDTFLEAVDQKSNPIFEAVVAKDVNLLRLLLMSKQFKVDEQDPCGSTALSKIFESKCLKRTFGTNPFTETEMQMIDLLLGAGANMFHHQGLHCICEKDSDDNRCDERGYSDDWYVISRRYKKCPLFKACRYGDPGLVSFLINNSQQQPFEFAIWKAILQTITCENRSSIFGVLSDHISRLFELHKPDLSKFIYCLEFAVKNDSEELICGLLNLIKYSPDEMSSHFIDSVRHAATLYKWPTILFMKKTWPECFAEFMKHPDYVSDVLVCLCGNNNSPVLKQLLEECVKSKVKIPKRSQDQDHPLDSVRSVKVFKLLHRYYERIPGLFPKDIKEYLYCGDESLLNAILLESPINQGLVDILLKNDVKPSKDILLEIYKECKRKDKHISSVLSSMPAVCDSDDSPSSLSLVLGDAIKMEDVEFFANGTMNTGAS